MLKKYKIIYADPPWKYDRKIGEGVAEKQYPTMEIEEICSLPIKEIADKDCILFLWATFPKLKEALKVIEAWGFRYRTVAFVWIKLNKKKKSKKLGYDEPIFLNSRSLVTEGATSNIFIIVNNEIYTPKLSCGLLNGIVRQYIISNYDVIESEIDLEFLNNADEIFLTNSLFGIMPVNNLEKKVLKSQEISKEILNKYRRDYEKNSCYRF